MINSTTEVPKDHQVAVQVGMTSLTLQTSTWI